MNLMVLPSSTNLKMDLSLVHKRTLLITMAISLPFPPTSLLFLNLLPLLEFNGGCG